jgi:murein hydrolase activator
LSIIPKIVLIFVLAYPFHATSKVDKDLKQLRGRIESLQQELAGKEESKSEVADALRLSEKAIQDVNLKLAELARAKNEAVDKLEQLQIQSQQIKKNIEAQQSSLGKLVYWQYVNGGEREEYLGLLLRQQDPDLVARNLHYYGHLSRARSLAIAAYRANLERLAALVQESEKKSMAIGMIHNEQAVQRNYLEQKKADHRKMLKQISMQVDQGRREIAKLKRDEERLARVVKEIARKLANKKRSQRLSNNSLPDASSAGKPFSAMKGRLRLPVRGELVNGFGSPRTDGGVTWKGLFIKSPNGQEIKAVAAGRVVFADWLRGFGNLMIVDHGANYMSLYGNNEANRKKVGDAVRGGDTIATVGNSGGDSDSGLYFELRHRGKPFDPLTWVAIK